MAPDQSRWTSDRDRWRPSEEERRRGAGYGQEGHGREEWGAPGRAGGGGGYGREGYGGRVGGQGAEGYGRRAYGGYEGSFGGYGREGGYRQEGHGGREHGREAGYSRAGYGGRDERGFWERASDEAASWFGDRDAERRREQDHRGRGPKGYRRSDGRIQEEVNDRLTDDPYVDASEIEVSVGNGEVTLSGAVDSRYARRRAEDVAEQVSGVAYVQNNLRVRQARGGSDEIARGMSEAGSGAAPGAGGRSSGGAGGSSR